MSPKKKKINKNNKTSSSLHKFASELIAGSNKKTVRWISFFLLIITVLAYYPNHGGDYDIWWHLKYGEHYVDNVTWNIDHTDYSWTPADGEWKYVTWIGSSFLFLIYRAAAFPGLHVLQLVILSFIRRR